MVDFPGLHQKMNLLWISIFVTALSFTQGTVYIYPFEGVVSTPGGNATFQCISSIPHGERGLRIQWLMNESAALVNETIGQGNAVAYVSGGIEVLNFTEIPLEFNQTRIQCNASLSSGNQFVSEIVLLQLQGLLSAVGSLKGTIQDFTISLTWTAPFTLDMRDVSYCVGVVNSTSSSTLHSQCGITETEYEYPIPPDSACHNHMVTVTPVNPAGNGASSTLTYSQTSESPQVNEIASVSHTTYTIVMSVGVCSSELTIMDLDTGEIITLRDEGLNIAGNNITLTTEQLSVNRHYNVTIRASNSVGSDTSFITLSTHGILNATTTETDDDAIVITTLYSEHSDARGALFDFVFIDDNGDVDFTRSVLLALDRNTSLHHTLPFNLYPGQYRVFVYGIESDGTLSNGVGYPAVTSEHSTRRNGQGLKFQPICLYCSITVFCGFILAECSQESPINSALFTGFQMIAQLNNSSEVHKLHINQSMDLQTPVTVEVEESGVYQVTIFAIKEETGIVRSFVGHVQIVVGDVTSYIIDPTVSNTTILHTPISRRNSSDVIIISLGTALGIFILVSIVMCGVIIVQCYMIRSQNPKRITSDMQLQLDVTNPEELTVANQESQLYEEIGDMNTPTSTGNTGVSSSAPGTGTAAVRAQYEYEDVKPVGSGVAKSSDPYDITLCSAYGVSTMTGNDCIST